MKIYIKKLGCPKNDVDADYIAARLIEAGHELVTQPDKAEAVVVNTCGFILPAKEESINEIAYFEKLKEEGRIKGLYVTGCLSQRYGHELLKEMPTIDGIFGLGQLDSISANIGNVKGELPILQNQKASQNEFISYKNRFIDSSYPFEYLKIADGCDRFCSYCAIPHIRGHFRSRDLSSILEEARMIAGKGKKELILVSQEGTGYGRDLAYDTSPVKLLEELEKIDGLSWIRLIYLHPESLSDDLIDYMSQSEKVLAYFDMPLQHINSQMLSLMNRKVDRQFIEDRLNKIRKANKNNIIRTTFITGHPGETEEAFEELRDFIVDSRFDRMGVFCYSSEEGTAAYKMKDKIDEKIAAERQDILMALQQEIAFEQNIALIDKRAKVIIDEIKSERLAIGRTRGDCPDIDQIVYVSGQKIKVGDIIEVLITAAEGYDLIARMEAGDESDK